MCEWAAVRWGMTHWGTSNTPKEPLPLPLQPVTSNGSSDGSRKALENGEIPAPKQVWLFPAAEAESTHLEDCISVP